LACQIRHVSSSALVLASEPEALDGHPLGLASMTKPM
jgi:hypothetical protein